MGQEIREDNWNGTDFDYPLTRLAINNFGPAIDLTNGPCQDLMSDISFSVYVYAQGQSSKECLQILGVVANSLLRKRIETSDVTTVVALGISQDGIIMPVPDGERLWRGEVVCNMSLKDKGQLT